MSAAELATVVEGWATLAGLMVVTAGAVFAGVQLRQEAKARRLQALVTVLSDIRPPEAAAASEVVRRLPDGFQISDLDADQQRAVSAERTSYARLGVLLEMRVVGEDEIFPDVGLSRGAIEAWERLKHLYRGSDQTQGRFLPETSGIRHERLAARAQAWLLRRGVQELGSVPHFDADRDALAAMGREVAAARAAASGAPPTRVA